MELPRRGRGDELLRPGELAGIRSRLRAIAPGHDLATVIACAFDHRTRMLPFILADTRMAPAGVRAIGSAMVDAGFHKTRIVLQQWSRSFRPSRMRLDGRIPDLFMVSSMQIHWAPCKALIQDACRIDPAHRPLIVVGGPKVIYEPWDVFSVDPGDPWAADVAVTGEEYVLLSLLEVLLSTRAAGESLRSAFLRARDSGALDEIPGLLYARPGRDGVAEELVDTGIQRLLGDLDELPSPALGFRLLEPPSDRTTLASGALPASRVRRYSPLGALVLTLGCKFGCPYCPIPAYDNFFNDQARTLDIAEALVRKVDAGSRPHRKIRWGTEATVHDTLRMKDHLPLMRRTGMWGLWLGVEDMTGALVRKGQGADKTVEAFALLRESGIFPIPMMMHHDSQPLLTRKGNAGLLNQVGLLRKAGAVYMQVMMLTPSPGSKLFVDTYASGLAYANVDGVAVEPHLVDGNRVVASRHRRPWVKQLNLLAAYVYFYNPLRFLIALVRPKTRIPLADTETLPAGTEQEARPRRGKLRGRIRRKARAFLGDAAVQVFGMWGLTHTIRRTLGWAYHLRRGRITRHTAAPTSRIPMRGADGGPASHALPGTPTSQCRLPES